MRRDMKLKNFKRRKELCKTLRKEAAHIIRIGIFCAVWIPLSIKVGMPSDRYAWWIVSGLVAMTVGYVLGRTVRYLEKRGMFFRRITKKQKGVRENGG